MISMLRVDHRLLHGQVAFSWTGALKADCILIANDDVPVNNLRKNSLRMAKPANVKLVMKSIKDAIAAINSGVTDQYQLLIVVESIKDAAALVNGLNQTIYKINLGGTKATPETRNISKAINLTKEEEVCLEELKRKGIVVSIQQVPSETEKLY